MTYIGKSAFENNALTSVFIPDSVTTIAEDAFKAAGSKQLWGESISFAGMRNVTSLASGSFSGMFDASIEAPALTALSADAFQPQFDGGAYASPCYTRVYTTNNNANKLQSIEGGCIVDPITYAKRAVDSETGAVLDSTVYYGKNVTTLSSDKSLSEFFTPGEVLSGESVENSLAGYARPKATKDVELNMQDVEANFAYKPCTIKTPLGVSADQTALSGTAFPGATVTLSSVTGTSYWNQTVTQLASATADEQGAFSFDLTQVEGFSLQDFSGYLTIDATIDSADYAGSAYQAQIAVGTAAPALEGVDVIQLKVKQGESVKLPSKVTVKYADGTTKENVSATGWTPRAISSEKPGEYWARAKATDYTSTTENSVTVLACVTVEAVDDYEKADTSDLLRSIDSARALLRSAVVSADGTDVSPDEMWVNQETYDALANAIKAASGVANNDTATQVEVDQQNANLAVAMETFANARLAGTGSVAIETGTVEIKAWFEKMEDQTTDPGVVLRATDGTDDNSVPYVGFSHVADDSGQLSGAFEGMGITGVEFSEGTVGIYPLAFYENSISTVELPEGLKWVGVSAFMNSGLTSVTFNEDIEHIREGAFADNSISRIEIPDSITEIEGHTFSGNGMRSVKLPANLESIGERAFWGNSLTELQIPLTLKSIADNAFEENGGKVILRTPDGTNPHGLTNSSFHVINPGQDKPSVDKSALLASIEKAEKLRGETTVSDFGSGVAAGTYWVSSSADKALEKALIEANYQYESASATAQTVEAARTALDQALSEYEAARRLAQDVAIPLLGDVNNNGKLNIVDAQLAYDLATKNLDSQAINDLLSAWGTGATLSTLQKIADFNGDGTLDAADAFAIQCAALGVKPSA